MKTKSICVAVLLLNCAAFSQQQITSTGVAEGVHLRINMPRVGAGAGAPAAQGPSVDLGCVAPVSGPAPTGYNFYRGTVSGGPYIVVGPNQSTCSYTDTTVQFLTTYYYVVTALSGSLESAYSNQATAVIPANPVPNPPTGLTVNQIVAGKVELEWNAPEQQAGITVNCFDMFRCGQRNCISPKKIGDCIHPTSYTDSPGVGFHWYEVKAEDTVAKKNVETAASNIIEAIVK